ncbi:MAG TPA: FAD-binding oxidoreductase [Chthonomonadaceae bacterium]|nr:FAD-binding oxidoreductase [Chthonomonadaceae bacterium]
MDSPTLLSELAAQIGAENVETGANRLVPAGWPQQPVATVLPNTAAEVAHVVRAAEAAGVALVPCGGGTQLQTGYPPRPDKPFLLLGTARLNRVLDHQPDDLTVTCEAGVTLASLQQTLATRHQRLAVDVPLPERATLGGLVSTNATGLWRPAYGSPRDLVIGLRAVMTEGVQVKGGGKVVKNVAGYDVCKLFTGAWGTLGVLTEISFKVQTQPETERTLAWDAPDAATAARIGLDLHHARLAAAFVLATNEPDGKPRLILGVQGTAARVAWQAEEFARRAADAGLNTPPIALTPAEVAALRDRQARLDPGTPLAARIACLPNEVAELVRALEALPALFLTAHVATGLVFLAATASDASLLPKVKTLLPPNAHLVWQRLEGVDREAVEVWGATREDFALQRALKQTLDPKDTFSPGRFVGRL